MTFKKTLESMPGYSVDDVLCALGLERTRTTMDRLFVPAIAVLGAGLVGFGLGLLFAPKPGSELRAEIKEQVSEQFDKLSKQAEKLATAAGIHSTGTSAASEESKSTSHGTAGTHASDYGTRRPV